MLYSIKTTFDKGNIEALQICKELGELIPSISERLIFDFRSYRENNPFGNLIIINSLRRFRECYQNAQLSGIPKEIDGYLSHIGFYKAIGIDVGKNPGEAKPSNNYVPITEISLKQDDFYERVEQRAYELSTTLRFDSGLREMLKYFFIETIRNAFEHAGIDSVLVAAQKWSSKKIVEIAIADAGCGIHGSLGKKYAMDSTKLLALACEPGISAKSNYHYLDKDDPWRNSGYGLYIMKELTLAYHGSFILCSGGNALRYSNGEGVLIEEAFDTDYKGTAIGLRFYTDTDLDFCSARKEILEKGEKRARDIKGAIKKASRSSGGRYYFSNIE